MGQQLSKYGNIKVKINGYTFDSKKEAARYRELQLLEKAGEITELVVHPKFQLQPAFKDWHGITIREITYSADFGYIESGRYVVEDVKGGKATQTRHFADKVKMLKYKYPELDFRIVK